MRGKIVKELKELSRLTKMTPANYRRLKRDYKGGRILLSDIRKLIGAYKGSGGVPELRLAEA